MGRPQVDDPVATERLFVAHHEAAHAVVAVILGGPLSDARITEKRRWGRVKISGSVNVADDGGEKLVEGAELDAYLVAALAGPETDAQFFHRNFGEPLARARRRMIRDNRDGDYDNVRYVFGQPDNDGAPSRLHTVRQVEGEARRARLTALASYRAGGSRTRATPVPDRARHPAPRRAAGRVMGVVHVLVGLAIAAPITACACALATIRRHHP
jgi:hypothetical protein